MYVPHPKNFGIAGSIGVLAFNGIIGGLIGGIIVIARMIAVFVEIIKMIAGTSGHDVKKCDNRDIMIKNGEDVVRMKETYITEDEQLKCQKVANAFT